MARQNVEGMNLDVKEILKRMCDAGKFDGIGSLATYLGLSPQALRQSGDRKSIALAPLLKIRAKSGASLEYLVFGGEQQYVAINDAGYVCVERIGGGAPIKVLTELLRPGVDIAPLRAYLRDDQKLFVIDTADKTLGNGLFAFGLQSAPVIRKCGVKLDGTVVIEREDIYEPKDLAIIGRVVLTMSRPSLDF